MNRRDFLKTVGIGVGSTLVGAEVIQALAAPDLPVTLGKMAQADQRDAVSHILNRVTFGPRPGQVEAVKKIGVQAYLEQQLNPLSIDDSASEQRLSGYTTLDKSPAELDNPDIKPAQIIAELDSATLMRAVYSEHQLFQIMVNFWSDHFNIYHLDEDCKILKTMDDRDVIRKYALGKFRDLLGASAKSPAMLIYLDNAKSQKKHPNENYAREVMELHTLGVGNYSEDDVKEIARCLTGWAVQGRKADDPGKFIYNPKIHDDGAKKVLGKDIPAGGGIQDGETVLDILASHPATARHIATKLCRRFVSDDPPDSLISSVAQMFMNSGGDIPSMLRAIFASPEFFNAPPKFKRPFEYLVSMYRAFNVEIEPDINVDERAVGKGKGKGKNGLASLSLLKMMGQLPFNRITPDGYTDHAAEWIDNMLIRWNIAIYTAHGLLPGITVDPAALVTSQGVELKARPVIDYFANHLLGRQLSTAELDAIWKFVSKSGEPDLSKQAGQLRTRSAVALIAASPAFQYR
jgi:uncharacterized protein (DUF1800 family)